MNNQSWVGKMYLKFEAACHEVDEIVNKDIKFVEDHMQTVGESVKKFYSEVVQDFVIPPLIPSNRVNLVETSTSSLRRINQNTVDNNRNKSKVISFVSTGLNHSEEIISEISEHPIEETNKGDNLKKTKESSLVSTGLNHSEEIISKISEYPVEEATKCDNLINKTLDKPNTSTINQEKSMVEGSCKDDDHSDFRSFLDDSELYGSVFEDADWGIENITDEIVNEPLFEEKTEKVSRDEFKTFLNTSNVYESSKLESSMTSDDNKEDCLPENLLDLSNSCFKNSLIEPDTVYHDPTESMRCSSKSSHGFLFCESDGPLCYDKNNSDSSRFTSSTFALSKGEENESMVEVDDLNLETIDLVDTKDKKQFVEGENVFAIPYKSTRSKSYKKIIQDAFTSRKRLTKEYKELAVLYGNIDDEFKKPTFENTLPIFDTTPISSVQDSLDSEWELV